MQQKERLAGNHKQCDALHLHIDDHIWKVFISLGGEKKLKFEVFPSGAPKERLESIINKHLMFTNPNLGLFL